MAQPCSSRELDKTLRKRYKLL